MAPAVGTSALEPTMVPTPPRSERKPAVAARLRALATPCFDALSTRLAIARHQTLLNDRLDSDPPALRYRLIPRRAPFDEPPPVAGAVLELVVDGNEVSARYWLDPLGEEPAEVRRAHGDELTAAWLEAVCVDFVAKTLHRS